MRLVQGERFDHVLAMDSIIHYAARDGVKTLETLADSVDTSMVFTFAPKTVPPGLMHAVGKLFPRADRSPPLNRSLRVTAKYLANSSELSDWRVGREHRVSTVSIRLRRWS